MGKQLEIANNNLKLIETEIALRQKNGENIEGLLDQQLTAIQEVAAAERELTLTKEDQARRIREIEQDAIEQRLDGLIDGFDNQKKVNELLLADETKTIEERKKIIQETKDLGDTAFEEQIKSIQEATDVQIDANDLLALRS